MFLGHLRIRIFVKTSTFFTTMCAWRFESNAIIIYSVIVMHHRSLCAACRAYITCYFYNCHWCYNTIRICWRFVPSPRGSWSCRWSIAFKILASNRTTSRYGRPSCLELLTNKNEGGTVMKLRNGVPTMFYKRVSFRHRHNATGLISHIESCKTNRFTVHGAPLTFAIHYKYIYCIEYIVYLLHGVCAVKLYRILQSSMRKINVNG